ncbi:MAG: flagellar motor protein [Candidatus Marinimicrobia bacterium]|nr:flagellar motor protein [Candidatus Neomarinimicrobiota bacterium]
MDLATIIGIALGLFFIISQIVSGGNAEIFIHVPSMMIVAGGTLAATLVSFPLKEVIGVMKVVKNAFRVNNHEEAKIIQQFVDLAQITRKNGILAMDKELSKIKDDFMRTGLEMTVDGTEPETIKAVMETELIYLKSRHKRGQQIFLTMGTYSPAFGMIGTLIGLITMLKNLEDPSTIGMGMAVALITTFYGSFLANLVFLPIAEKLKNRSSHEVSVKELVIEGVISIQLGEHPRNIQRKLLNFISPSSRPKEKNRNN